MPKKIIVGALILFTLLIPAVSKASTLGNLWQKLGNLQTIIAAFGFNQLAGIGLTGTSGVVVSASPAQAKIGDTVTISWTYNNPPVGAYCWNNPGLPGVSTNWKEPITSISGSRTVTITATTTTNINSDATKRVFFIACRVPGMSSTEVSSSASTTVSIAGSATCSDSDGPKNFYTKGQTYGTADGGAGLETKTWTDYCTAGGYAYDFTCKTNIASTSDKMAVWADSYKCPNGCSDGACVWDNSYEPITFALNKSYADKLPNWKQQADKIIDGANSVYQKTTTKKFKIAKYLVYNDSDYNDIFANTEKHPEFYQTINNYQSPLYILLVTKDGISNEELKSLYGSDTVNVMYQGITQGGKNYAILLQQNPESFSILLDQWRPMQSYFTLHELGHHLGLGGMEFYLNKYTDCTGVSPKFEDYNIVDSPLYKGDPMIISLVENFAGYKFSDLNSKIIKLNPNLQYIADYISDNWFSKITKVKVEDGSGNPISGAIVKIYCAKKSCWYCYTKCDKEGYGQAEQTLTTDSNGYTTYNGPSGHWDFNETSTTPCLAKAIKVYYNGKSAVKTVNFIDLQRSYLIDNSNENLTKIIIN